MVLNVTVTNATAPGFITASPSGVAWPGSSNLNFVAGQTVPNLVISRLGANGKISLYSSAAGTVDLVADLVGWYGGSGATKLFTPLPAPSRFLDSRSDVGLSGVWSADKTRSLGVAGVDQVPADAKRGRDERHRHQRVGRQFRDGVPVERERTARGARTSTSSPVRRCPTS